MDPNWLNALIGVATLLVVLTSMLIGYFFKLSKELSNYKTHVAENYVTKDEFKDHAERLERQMETGFNRLYETLNRREIT
jgi:hypothetical protein